MKSTRRHELKQNALGMEIGKIGTFLRQHGTLIASLILVAAIVVFVAVYVTSRSRQQQASLQAEYDRLVSDPTLDPQKQLEGLKALADQDDFDQVSAMAGLAVGDIYLSQGLVLPAAERPAALQNAAQAYQKVVSSFEDLPAAQARAYVGLARVAETQGQFDQAAQNYQAVLAIPAMTGHPVRAIAEAGLNALPNLRTPAQLATTRPTTAPATQGATTNPAAEAQPATAPASAS